MSSESGEGGLSKGSTSISISSCVWKLGDKIRWVLEKVVTKKEMAKSFGGRCPTTTLEGVISGIRANTKIFVQRQCDFGQIVLEYSRPHSLFKSSSEEGSKTGGKSGEKQIWLQAEVPPSRCFSTTSRPSPTCDSSFWWRTALWFSTGRVSGKILPIFTK